MPNLAFHDVHFDQVPDRQRAPEPSVTPAPHLEMGGAHLQWDSNGQTVAVHFHLNVIERLEAEAFQLRDAETRKVAGVLLGKIDYKDVVSLVVEDYEPASSSDSVVAVIDRWRDYSGRRMSAVGVYQASQSEEDVPDDDHLAVLANQLADQERVLLLVHAQVGRPSTAKLFLVRGGTAFPDETAIQFPFNRMEIANKKPQFQPGSRAESVGVQGLPPKPKESRADRALRVLVLLVVVSVAAITAVPYLARSLGWTSLGRGYKTLGRSQASPLDLKAEQHGNGWQLTWNSHAPAVVNATRARLFIADGYLQKNVDMTPVDLHTGKIFYVPAMDNVVLRLEVINQGGESVAESVRILAGFLPPSSSSVLDTATSTNTLPNSPTSFRTSGARKHQPGPPKVEATSEASAMGSAASAEPAIAIQNNEGENSITDNKPSALAESGLLTIPSAITKLPEPRAQSSAMQPQPFSKNSPAQPILLIDPIYPPTALDRRLQGKVIVKAVVEKDGKVTNIRVVSGPPILAQAAVEAMWKWQYNPASLNGEHVQSEAEVKFNFRIP